jgi:hypothetical protein
LQNGCKNKRKFFLSGFILKGAKFTDAMGTPDNNKFGFWNAYRGLWEIDHGRIVVRKELGEMILDLAVNFIVENLNAE